jgi:carbon starvation protein
MFQEFFEKSSDTKSILSTNRSIGTAVAVIAGGALTLSGQFSQIWPIFGSANQLLAALALLTVMIWLMKNGKSFWFAMIPMIFMYGVTTTALILLIQKNFSGGNFILTALGSVLLILALVLLIQAVITLRNFTRNTGLQVK